MKALSDMTSFAADLITVLYLEHLFCFRWLYYILSFYRSVIFVGIYITSALRRWKLRDLKRKQFLPRLWLVASAEVQSALVRIRLAGLFHTSGAQRQMVFSHSLCVSL